ncbi:MAG: hypothetical protein H6595_12035 [Flavobacteriales bacterium]|nr:hypothetical protein [Flavobacteriales bacterium]MCB9168191.1 hypothetical protein [Flavobacteriales bacterium]MCB9194244.1 hypothetical protein [Flavobacteriales bacterium]
MGTRGTRNLTTGNGAACLSLLLLVLLADPNAAAGRSRADTVAVPTGDTTLTLGWKDRHSPTRAAIYSAVIPGLGQVYNRKYWKVPIVFAGLGVSYYFIDHNRSQFHRYKDAYLAIVDGDPNTVDEFNGAYSASAVLDVADTYRRWRDISYICGGLVYILNIMDAAVDAYFVHFDVSEDLSLNIAPAFDLAAQGAMGIGLRIRL